MTNPASRIDVCAADEVVGRQREGVTHIVAVGNPGSALRPPAGFTGEFLAVRFGDVVSEEDARQWQTEAPTPAHLQCVLLFCREALRRERTKVLFYCDKGASRSPALAYVVLADGLGPGREPEALQAVRRIREQAVPNRLVAALGDVLLGRQGALVRALTAFERELLKQLVLPPEA